MIHLGDITKIHGDQIEPVDCITFGSPCQGLSMAGKRLGFDDNRSVLFLDAARIINEMRTATNGMYPTFAVWENVPGAFSSNGGEDFRAVLEELARIEQPDVSIPRPSGRGGRWSKAGAIAGTGWSLAWRQLDAQYWGVPQRRKRIALVADFRGQRAAEILFERTSLSVHPDESIKAWEATSGSSQASHSGCDRASEKAIYDARGNGDGRTCPTITGDHENRITDYTAIVTEPEDCLTPWDNQARRIYSENGTFPALAAREKSGGNQQAVLIKRTRWIVRRLTPTECERLQGYPDGWTDIGEWTDTKGKKHKAADSPRYKALGNSIALPQWFWIVQKMKLYLPTDATLGSLFDGIGGFPLVWETTYGTGTARWASEIEEFPIAVTKKHFPERNEHEN
nr:MAG TPA: Cytosine specific methyltransferase [Siphoviridae sp. ctAeS79]